MGNIFSYFFPQPTQPSIEKEEEVIKDEKKEQEIPEQIVAEKIKETEIVSDTNTADSVLEKDIDPEPEVQVEEEFEVVEESVVSEIENSQQKKAIEAEPVGTIDKEESPGPIITDEGENAEMNEVIEPNLDEAEIEMVENALKLENSESGIHEQSLQPADVEVIGSIQDKVEEEIIKSEPKDLSESEVLQAATTEPINILTTETEKFVVPELPDNDNIPEEEIIEETGKNGMPETQETLVPEMAKAELKEDLQDLIKTATELIKEADPEVEIIGSITDDNIHPKEPISAGISDSSFCGTVVPDLQDYELKEGSPPLEAELKSATPEVEIPVKEVTGVEGLKEVLTESDKVRE